MKKWIYELIIVVILICIGLGIWWFVSTRDERQVKVEYEQLVDFAERQEVEITVLKQTVELQRLKAEFQERQQIPLQRTIIESSENE